MVNPLVTIITPSFNQASFIRSTIESVLGQDYPHIEYIIVDGGSTDSTIDILRSYGDKIRWISEPDRGQSDAINKGFRMANGEIVAWLNSDDTYEPGAVTNAVAEFIKNPEIGLLYGDGNIIDENGNLVAKFGFTREFNLWSLIHLYDYILQPTTFFQRKALESVNYLDINLHYGMDWDLWIKLGSKYPVCYLKKTLANSREYGETKTSTGGWKRFDEICALMRKYGTLTYPPGYWFYGFDTISKIVSPVPALGRFIQRFTGGILCRYIQQSIATIYQDNWAGPECNLWLLNGSQEKKYFKVTIDVPNSGNRSYITCYVDNKELLRTRVNTGKNTLMLKKSDSSELSKLTITCSQSFTPFLSSRFKDWRRLSYRIVSIEQD